jgi:hypothetical protein
MLYGVQAKFMQSLFKVYARMKSLKSEKYQRKTTYPIWSWLAWRRRQRPQSAADAVPAKCLREYMCPVPGGRLCELQSGELSKVVSQNTSGSCCERALIAVDTSCNCLGRADGCEDARRLIGTLIFGKRSAGPPLAIRSSLRRRTSLRRSTSSIAESCTSTGY